VVPLGVVSMNVTVAPATGEPLLVTKPLIGTEPGGAKVEPATEMLIASEGVVDVVDVPIE
jgi:hypothetical protein